MKCRKLLDQPGRIRNILHESYKNTAYFKRGFLLQRDLDTSQEQEIRTGTCKSILKKIRELILNMTTIEVLKNKNVPHFHPDAVFNFR